MHWNKFIWLAIVIIIVGGIAVLVVTGRSFVKEVTQEIIVNQREESTFAIIDQEAPNFELSDINGNKVKRSDFLGTPLVIMFWATWNAVSADQVKIIDGYLSKDDGNLFKLITVNNQENSNTVSNFISRGGYKLDILLDENGEVGESYQVKTLPVFYFIDKEGVIKNLHIGLLSQDEIIAEAEPALR